MTLAFLPIRLLPLLMRDNLVYFLFFIFTFLSIRFGDLFGFLLMTIGFFTMLHIMDKDE